MKRFACLFLIFFTAASLFAMVGGKISLNGEYRFLPGYSESSPGDLPAAEEWGSCSVPALWWEAEGVGDEWAEGEKPGFIHTPSAWYKYDFFLPRSFAGLDARLEVESVFWGCEAWINGNRLGKHVGGYAPFALDCRDSLKIGEMNTVLFRVYGWPSIPRNEQGEPLIPVAVDAFWANKSGGFTGDVKLHFHHDAGFIRNVQIIPDAEGKSIRGNINASLGNETPYKLMITVKDAFESPLGEWSIPLEDKEKELPVSFGPYTIDGADVWRPDFPMVYTAEVELLATNPGGVTSSDQREIRFGLRDIESRESELFLNGEPLRIFGASLFEEARFKRGSKATRDPDFYERYLIDVPRAHNINCLRTHLGPMNEQWLNTCDAGGMMVLLEFPVFYWNDDPQFLENAKKSYEALVERMVNHPSIIGWAVSNEGWKDDQRKFEKEEIIPWFREKDPTRLVFRAGDVTTGVADIHAYEGMWNGTMTEFVKRHEELKEKFPDRVHANTEYLETGAGSNGIWYSKERAKRFFDDDATSPKLVAEHARIAMTQTEILRRMDFDIIIPYWYADWVNIWSWVKNFRDRENYPKSKPTLEAIRQAFSPVGISLAPDFHNVYPGLLPEIPVFLMNDARRSFSGEVSAMIFTNDPGFSPEELSEDDALVKIKVPIQLDPYAKRKTGIQLRVPQNLRGKAWIVAMLSNSSGYRVMSRRETEVFASPDVPLSDKRVMVVPGNSAVERFFMEQGAELFREVEECGPGDVIVVSELKQKQKGAILKKIRNGAVCIVMNPEEPVLEESGDMEFFDLKHGTDHVFFREEMDDFTLRRPNGPAAALSRSVKNFSDNWKILSYGYPDSSGEKAPGVIARKIAEGLLIYSMIDCGKRLETGSEFEDAACRHFLTLLVKKSGELRE